MIRKIREIIHKVKQEYSKSFIFGMKLLFLISLLIFPIIVGSSLSVGVYIILERMPFSGYSEFKIISIQTYPFDEKDPLGIRSKNKKEYVDIFKLESGKDNLYVRVNRKPLNKQERNELKDNINKVLQDEETKEIVLEKGSELHIPEWEKTIKYAGLSPLGIFLMSICTFIITIVSLALYFPIVKAIVNLFKRKRILKNE